MTARLNPYLNFRDNAKDALEFYHSVLGGDLVMTTFGEGGMSGEGMDSDKIMHGMITAENGMVLMAADVPAFMELTPGSNFTVSLSGDEDALLRGYWNALTDGGTIDQALVVAPWGDAFGMCHDKFGTSWMVNITGIAVN